MEIHLQFNRMNELLQMCFEYIRLQNMEQGGSRKEKRIRN